MINNIEKLTIILILFFNASLSTPAGTFGNAPAHIDRFGESRDSSFSSSSSSSRYDYMYGQRYDREQERTIRTGRDVNYYYVPRRPGTSNCSRYDRNYVYCE